MVLIDNTFLSLMLYPRAKPPQDPFTKKPLERIDDRIEKLVEDLDSESERIVLPTPVLSEFLILVGKDAPGYLEKLSGMKNILIKPFDELAAIELAAAEVEDRERGASAAVLRALGRNSGSTVRSLRSRGQTKSIVFIPMMRT